MTGIAVKANHQVRTHENHEKMSLGKRFLAYLHECFVFYGKMYSRPITGRYEEVHYEK